MQLQVNIFWAAALAEQASAPISPRLPWAKLRYAMCRRLAQSLRDGRSAAGELVI